MTRTLADFPGGLELPTGKILSDTVPSIQAPLPEQLIIPLQQHIGQPATPCVSVGDQVLKGQVIARAGGEISVPVHASSSGRIIDISPRPIAAPTMSETDCIVIKTDGRDAWTKLQPVGEYASLDPLVLQQAIIDAGIVGLGGAGFPTHQKLREGIENSVETLIINGVECEPYITCDDRLIQEKAHYVVAGARMIRHAVQARHCVIAVEDDMPEAYEALAAHAGDDIELLKVPTRYPAGGEKQLIQTITGREVPSGGLAIHIGVVMQNVATAAAMYRAVTRGEPVISRYITITGDGVARPRNLQVLIGTPVRHCLELSAHDADKDYQIILGGPMMGIPLTDLDSPVTKTSNCVLVQKPVKLEPEMPCIRCGDCADVCPVRLLPQQLYWFARSDDQAAAREHRLFDCIECGCCAYVCPSHIPLVDYYRQAKQAIAESEQRREDEAHARRRYLARQERLARQASEKEAGRRQQQSSEAKPAIRPEDNKREQIAAAVARARAKRARLKSRNKPDND